MTPLIYVSLTLAASLAVNVFLGRAIIVAGVECRADITQAQQQQVIDSQAKTINQFETITDLKMYDDALLRDSLWKIAEKAQDERVVYRTRNLPTPTCGPGQERMDAVNEILKK